MRYFGIFAKYWRPGSVKTRLAVTVGPELAAQFHRVSLQTLLARLDHVADRHVLAVWPPEQRHQFQAATVRWMLTDQVPGDLGTKMAAYFRAAFSGGATKAVLIGSDSPTISSDVIREAYAALDEHDVVLGPCEDGGYYLVGCRDPLVPIWDGIAWSTPDVWSQTIAALERAQCRWHKLPAGFDVDDIDDVRLLFKVLCAHQYAEPVWDALRKICEACLWAQSDKVHRSDTSDKV